MKDTIVIVILIKLFSFHVNKEKPLCYFKKAITQPLSILETKAVKYIFFSAQEDSVSRKHHATFQVIYTRNSVQVSSIPDI